MLAVPNLGLIVHQGAAAWRRLPGYVRYPGVAAGCAFVAFGLGGLATGGYGHAAGANHYYHLGCHLAHCFSITGSAGRLSAFAGVLTALTFSALVFLLGRDDAIRTRLHSTIILFTAAFVALIFATYLFTDAAAEEAPAFRAAAVSFAASLALGIAILQLFLGIVSMVGHRSDATFLVRVAAWFVGPAVFYFLMATAVNAWGLAMTSQHEWHSALAQRTQALFSVWLFVAFLPWPVWRRRSLVVWVTGSLATVAVATFFVGYWGEEAPLARLTPDVYFCAMAALFVLGTGYSGFLKGAEMLPSRSGGGGSLYSRTGEPLHPQQNDGS